jgi:predicted metal-dependent hydrolase
MIFFAHKMKPEFSLAISVIRVAHLRRMSLRVEPGGAIIVRAPRRVTDEAIKKFVLDQEVWIQKQTSAMQALVSLSEERLIELKKLAQIYLPERVQVLADKYHFHFMSLSLRHQQTRWGSCSQKNALNLNIELMRLPLKLRDYIILHELTHTIHKHHQKAFWNHLEKVLPGALLLDREMRQWKIGYERET